MSKFVDALEACVREAAARVAATSHVWHDHCVSPGEKTRVQVAAAAAAACVDTPKWHNRYKADCGRYVIEGHCIGGGAAKGHEWALGAEFDYPERSCCACGKGRTSTGHVVH